MLIVGEQGGRRRQMVFVGFGLGVRLQAPDAGASHVLARRTGRCSAEPISGLRRRAEQGVLGGEFTPELLGVGYIIGRGSPASWSAGGMLAYSCPARRSPSSASTLPAPIFPPEHGADPRHGARGDPQLYILYIGAGAVATGGIISMSRPCR